MKALLIILALFLFNSPSWSKEGEWGLHVDRKHTETIQSILQSTPNDFRTGNLFNFGFTQDVIWISRSLSMPNGGTIAINNPQIKKVDFFLAANSIVAKEAHFIYLRNLDTNIVDNSILLFEIPSGFEGKLVIRFESTEALVIPLEIIDSSDLYRVMADKLTLGYLIAGAIATLVFLYLVFFISLRDRAYFYYLLYAITVIVTVLRVNGLLYYWFPFSKVFDNYSSLFETMPTITAGIFTLHFLQVKQNYPLMYKVILAMVIAQVANLFISLVGYNTLAFILTDLIAFAFIPIAIGLGYKMWRVKKYSPAKYYLFSWIFLFVGANLYLTRNYGLWQSDLALANHSIDLGIAIEMLFLAVGLSKRVEQLRRDKENLQADNIRILNNKKRELELLVAERTKDLEAQNEEIMQQQHQIEQINSSLEQTVKERTDQLEDQNKKLLEYAYFNAHKVRGPLARILGLTYLVQKSPNDNPIEMIKRIEVSARELDKVITDVNQSLTNNHP
jgi:two-component system NtrC family sensor kinase